jgi:hypothetical protein
MTKPLATSHTIKQHQIYLLRLSNLKKKKQGFGNRHSESGFMYLEGPVETMKILGNVCTARSLCLTVTKTVTHLQK